MQSEDSTISPLCPGVHRTEGGGVWERRVCRRKYTSDARCRGPVPLLALKHPPCPRPCRGADKAVTIPGIVRTVARGYREPNHMGEAEWEEA